MYNNLNAKQNEEIKSEGILIFKDTMEYLIDGILTAEQYAELTRMIYATRWGDGVNEKAIQDKLLLGIWKTLKHTIKKSARNARYRENNLNKKSAIQNITETEFDIPQNPNNLENEIKAILSPENTTDDNLYIQDRESGLNSLKIAKNNEFEIEDNTDEINNKEISENMGQCLGTLDELKTKNQDVEVIMQNWFEDDDNVKMYNRWINALVQYKYNTTPENEEMALGADRKLNELYDMLNIQNKNEYLQYVKEDIDYKIAIIEKNQRIA